MKWFNGNVAQAITESRARKVAFMVYIEGDNEDSNKMKSVWEQKEVSDLCCEKNCVGIRIDFQSEQFQQFSHFYPVVCIPSTYVIGDNGVPLEIIGGALTAEEFTVKIQAAFQVYQNSSSGASKMAEPQTETPVPLETATPGPSSQTETVSAQNKEDEQTPSTMADTADVSGDSSSQSIEDRVERAKELVEKRRQEKEEEEKEKLRVQEMNRRKMGQEMAKAKQKREEQDMRDQAAKIREERMREKAAREAVKEAIARDRAEKEKLRQLEKAQLLSEQSHSTEPSTSRDTLASSKSSSARIQFRLPDGGCVVNTFEAEDILESARKFVSQHLGGKEIVMCTAYPRRQLTEEDCSSTLRDLGLTPTSTIIVALSSQVARHGGGGGGGGIGVGDILSYLFVPILTIWNAIRTFLFGTPSEPHGVTSEGSTTTEPRTTEQSSNLRRRKADDGRSRREGNIHRLRADDDDENNTWNGNSTQQM